MLITLLFLSFDKILYILKKINLYKYLPKYVTNNRFFANCISYINPKYIFFFKLNNMIYEYPLPIIMATIVKEGDIVVDIGANQGSYTVFLSRLVGQKGKVYAFEPDPRNFFILKHRTRKLKNVVIERIAVGNKKSKVKFYVDKFMSTSTIHKDVTFSPITCLEVDMVCLDDYFQDLKGNIALIKMDVQGSEPLVIDGMKNLIKKVKVLIFEFWPLGIKAAGFDPFSFIERISNNFELIYIDENFNSFSIKGIYNKINDEESLNIIAINKKYLKN